MCSSARLLDWWARHLREAEAAAVRERADAERRERRAAAEAARGVRRRAPQVAQSQRLAQRLAVEGEGRHAARGRAAVERVANGGIYTASQSLSSGLIDDIGDYQTALDWFEGRLGHEVTIVEQRRRAGLGDLLFGMRSDAAPSVAKLLTSTTGPRFLYFWQGGR